MYLRLFLFCSYFIGKVSAAPTSKDVLFEVEEMLRRNLNFSADPCNDFYNYACGNWMANNEIPLEGKVHAGSELFKQIQHQQKEAIEQISDSTNSIAEMELKIFYGKCLDLEALERSDNMEMISGLKELGPFPMMGERYSAHDSFDFTDMIIKIEAQGGYSFINADVGRNQNNGMYMITVGIYRIINIYYLITDRCASYHCRRNRYAQLSRQGFRTFRESGIISEISPREGIQNGYLRYIDIEKAKIISEKYNLSTTLERLKSEVEEVIIFATKIAEIIKNGGAQNIPMKLTDFQNIFPALDLNRYLKSLSPAAHDFFDSDPMIVVSQLRALEGMARLIAESNYSTIANFMMLQFTNSYKLSYNEKMRTINEEVKRVLGGEDWEPPERWQYCLNATENMLSHAYGALYVKYNFPISIKNEIREMIAKIKEAMHDLIGGEKWMDHETKKAAQHKLHKMKSFAGNPDWIENDHLLNKHYRELDFSRGDSFHQMVRAISIWKQGRKFRLVLNKIENNKEILERLIEKSVSIVNAGYSVFENSFVMHAAILNPPFYYPKFPKAINYGAIGMMIGHEITHGFDPTGKTSICCGINWVLMGLKGSQHNEDGILKNWWDDSTRQEFNERDQIDGINLKHQEGENVADLGGLKVVYKAYQMYLAQNGLEPSLLNFPKITNDQLFFLGYGQSWCSKETKEYLTEKQFHNEHPPNNFRVLLSTRNNPQFAKAFNCPAGSKMNPIEKCEVW